MVDSVINGAGFYMDSTEGYWRLHHLRIEHIYCRWKFLLHIKISCTFKMLDSQICDGHFEVMSAEEQIVIV